MTGGDLRSLRELAAVNASGGATIAEEEAYRTAASPDVVIALLDEVEKLRAERDRMSRQEQYFVDLGNKRIAELEKNLAAVTAARGELAEIAGSLSLGREGPVFDIARDRIAALRAVGGKS